MYVWFSDLDNTLIYSHRTTFIQEKVLVEYLRGKEQSFMTQETYNFMCSNRIKFIPVTTRSVEQYNRLFVFGKEIVADHALVCNGAILLNKGLIDEKWLFETKSIANKGIKVLEQIQNEISEYEMNNVEGVMLYFKVEEPEELAMILRDKYVNESVYIGYDKRKVYIVPAEINKGAAVKRYCSRFGITKTISSGDSEFDIPMLNTTNISIAPDMLASQIVSKGEKFTVGDSQIISDAICKRLEIIIEENIL